MSPKPRGTCPECGKYIQLKSDGRLRVHSVRRQRESWGRVRDCDGAGMLPKVETECTRCHAAPGTECCEAHGKVLCHRCYRETHFVEVCVEGCAQCAAESLPVVLRRTAVSE